MNAKIVSLIGVCVLAVGAWFFYQEDVKIEPTVPQAPKATYEVAQIKAVQTNEQTGAVEYTLTAESLVKNDAGEDEMVDVKMDWTPPNGGTYNLTASRAVLDQATGDIKLSQGFVLTKKGEADKPDMTMTGKILTGNTKTHQVQSDEVITIKQGDDEFVAQSMTANLQAGEYEFNQIAMQFDPPAREDKPLF